MKPALFLFSRTRKKDYRYLIALPSGLSEQAQTFITARQTDMQMDVSVNTLHFFVSETEALLVRITDTGVKDTFGRPITAMEGLHCPKEEIRMFWLCLSLIVPGFYASPSVYQTVIDGETVRPFAVSELLDTFMACSRKQPDAAAVTKAIYDAEQPACFTYDGSGLHLSVSSCAARRHVWTPQEHSRFRLYLVLKKKAQKAQLQAVCTHKPAYVLAKSSVSCTADGWHIPSLKASADALEQQLAAHGWHAADKGERS